MSNPDPFNKPLEPPTRFVFVGDDSDVVIAKHGNVLTLSFDIECETREAAVKLFERMETMKTFKLTTSENAQ